MTNNRLCLMLGLASLLVSGVPCVSIAPAAATTTNPGLKYYYAAPEAPIVDVEADIIVYGGTSGGVVAAVQAAREGKSVALIVFGRHVGGITSGGLTATDGVNKAHQGGITREFFDKVGNKRFLPSEAEAEFEDMLKHPVPGDPQAAPIPTYYEQRLDSVEKVANRIVALRMENGSVFRGRVFIDATYEGDLLAKAGVSYTFGREPRSKYGESMAGKIEPTVLDVDPYVEEGNSDSGLIPTLIDEEPGELGSGDQHIQAYNFRMFTVSDDDPDNYQPIFKPAEYDPDKFEILYRYHRDGGKTRMRVENDVNNHEMFAREVSTDHIGGNRWPDGKGGYVSWAEADYATREKMFQDHVAWQLGMLWCIQNDPRYAALAEDPGVAPKTRENIRRLINKMQTIGFPLGEYPETNGWPHELYVREARRMVSDYVATQDHYDLKTPVSDPVGLANYHPDSHHTRRILSPDGKRIWVEGDTGGRPGHAWQISYRSLIPNRKECDNLYVIWSISSSHVAFRSMRMEPCLMVLGQSAATAASIVIDQDIDVQDIDYDDLKERLEAGGQILCVKSERLPADNGVLVDNRDSACVEYTGEWEISNHNAKNAIGKDYAHDLNTGKGTKKVIFTPRLPADGRYVVYMNWPSNSNRSTKTPVEIYHANGVAKVSVNQRKDGNGWVRLGEWAFAVEDPGQVIIGSEGTDGYVIADAIFFEPVDANPGSATENR